MTAGSTDTIATHPETVARVRALAARWAGAKPAERANTQTYLRELCDALGVEPPRPAGSDYEFERAIRVFSRDGTPTTNFVDLYKAGHFILEAKDDEPGRSGDVLLRKAFGQARTYAAHDPSGAYPPYLLVLNGQRELLVWDRWTGDYGGFPAHRRVDLTRLADAPADVALLRDVWTQPTARDPRLRAQQVTERIAAKLAHLATSLEARGFDQERVSRFLMRCVFTMFAEDVRLLPDEPFRRLLDEIALAEPAEFVPGAEELWRAMDQGARFGFRRLLRFNGHFFRAADGTAAEALPLDRADLTVLLEAARADWSEVEPAIFGTLLTRALDPVERQRLGAEYTKPSMIARLIKPAVDEPIRERWTAVQADVVQLRETGRPKDRRAAEERLRAFHAWLRGLHVLDPACGSGNFLYVTMHVIKRVELEVLTELAALTGAHELRLEEVDPSQFHGIEVKPWAREIAELTLWIGFHQFWRRAHGDVQPEEPLLRDTGTLENRDAVLTWRAAAHDSSRDRPDPTPRVAHPVTGELVPDPTATIPYTAYDDPAPAAWPEADFIVGNPPYIGSKRMRSALGDGYVDALRAAYPNVPEAADLVMYWWTKAVDAVASGRTIAAGLITTNSITQAQNRALVARAAARGVRVRWAIADHVWNDAADDARVRVAMTVLAKEPTAATLVTVDGDARVVGEVRVPRLNDDLTAHADVATAARTPLRANLGLTSFGFMLNGAGFILEPSEARELLAADPTHADIIRPYRNGRDIAQRPRGVSLIDFGLRSLDEAQAYPVLLDLIRDRVKPGRDAARRPGVRDRWWRFAEARPGLRDALVGLARYIVTVETAVHRYFVFLDTAVAPDHKLIAVASDDPFVHGVLSSAAHITWALAAGARMGIDATPTYNKGPCFEAFPFPAAAAESRAQIGDVAERIDAHRRAALARDERITMTAMYHIVEKLRTGDALSAREREVHKLAACGTLRELHDRLDALVAGAYGWSWPEPAAVILERLVALHDARIDEEQRGTARWIRPAYQQPRVQPDETAPALGLIVETGDDVVSAESSNSATPAVWPPDAVGQITALRQFVATTARTVDDAARHFAGAPRQIVQRHLETLDLLGEVMRDAEGRYAMPAAPAVV